MMRQVFVSAGLIALALTGGAISPSFIPTAHADAYPLQGRANFTLDGTITTVDADRDRVILTGDHGRRYTVDTYRSQIALRDTSRPGETGDLVPGMRIHVVGRLLSSDIIEADRVGVLPYEPGALRPNDPVGQRNPDNRPGVAADDLGSINLRGTVESVNDQRGSFVVRIHSKTRTVFVTDQTDLQNFARDTKDRLPVQRGDRVTVTGSLRGDGSVLADTVAFIPSSENGMNSGDLRARQLFGRLTQEADYTSRDIKIRVSPVREIKIIVPHNIAIRRDGQPISVHELGKDDVIRVWGAYEGDNFKASRIEVIDNQPSA